MRTNDSATLMTSSGRPCFFDLVNNSIELLCITVNCVTRAVPVRYVSLKCALPVRYVSIDKPSNCRIIFIPSRIIGFQSSLFYFIKVAWGPRSLFSGSSRSNGTKERATSGKKAVPNFMFVYM